MTTFEDYFLFTWVLITILIPVAILIAGLVDFRKKSQIKRTLPRFLMSLTIYPLLVFLSFYCIAMMDTRFNSGSGGHNLGIREKVFLLCFLFAYSIFGAGLTSFVAQKLPFLKEAFNPVEEYLPSIITSK